MKKIAITLAVIFLIIGGIALYISTFHIEKVNIEGCNYVKEKTVKDKIDEYCKVDNTIYLYLKNKLQPIEDIPFVAKLTIDYESKNAVTVTVYEKVVAGYFEYLENYIYFDKDGIVLEVSDKVMSDAPEIVGLEINSWNLGQKIPLLDESKFLTILTITQLVEKYDVEVQKVTFTEDNEIVLKHDNIDIEIGNGDNLTVQMMNLGNILENLEGKEGILYMKDFTSDNSTASFKNK